MKPAKRFFSLLLCFLLSLAVVPAMAGEGADPTVTLEPVSFTEGSSGPEEGEEKTSVTPGDTLMVKVVLRNGTGNTYHLGTFGVKFTYNSRVFELYRYTNAKGRMVGPVVFATEDQRGFDNGSYAAQTNTGTTGEVYMSAVVSDTSEHALPVAPNGTVTLGYLMLKVKYGAGAAGTQQTFGFVPDGAVDKKNVVADVDMTTGKLTTLAIAYPEVSGTVTVAGSDQDYTLGDVDGNGKISTGDAVEILQSIVGKKTLTETQKKAADIDSNGRVTTGDAVYILQFIVGKKIPYPLTSD